MIKSLEIEKKLREVEHTLEDIGAEICSVRGGQDAWGSINTSLEYVRSAIHNCWKMD